MIGKLNDSYFVKKIKEFVYDVYKMKNQSSSLNNIRSFLDLIMNGYLNAKKDSFNKNHPMFKILKYEFKDYLKEICSERNDLKFDGSPGRGGWTNFPWTAIFNKKITESAQEGYYPVYLFSEDMKTAYLSLNQGATNLENKNGFKNAKSELELNALKFGDQLNGSINENLLEKISLNTKRSMGILYEAGNIFAKRYDVDNLPSEEELESDLNEILGLYELLVGKGDILKMIENPQEIKEAEYKFRDILFNKADEIIDKIHWSNDLGIGFIHTENDYNRYFNGFGISNRMKT